ncbi:hypothetical protein NE850_01455 [Paraburkholderia sp. USG1]|uniref:DUF7693 family protein n=1 Tax=Paraburkholderia sp. USG1 TaxID=2952268 RepID=UPI00285C1B67|nr:hypothetical protein [Paraburkholderia sp. USG1]MDR8394990.1 hypothetical protein [Paraburkholderia sp. USG1]
MKANIEASEVAEVFRQALRGEIEVKLTGDRSWKDIWCGDVEYMFGSWRVTIFNDVMDLDYVDSAIAPDGRTVEYDDWFDRDTFRGADPVDLLSAAEAPALRNLLENVEPETR